MNAKNGTWTKVGKGSGRRGIYDSYKNQIMIIIPREKNPDHLLLSPACFEALGKPDSVDLFTSGTNVGIAAASNGSGFKVSVPFSKKDGEISMYYTSPTRWRRQTKLRPGAYDAHIENGMIVFNTAQVPSEL